MFFLSNLCVCQAGGGRLKEFDHNQALCFYYTRGQCCQSSPLCRGAGRVVWACLPMAGALYFHLYRVYSLWKLFLLKLEEPGACSESMVRLTGNVNTKKGHLSAKCNGLLKYDSCLGHCSFKPIQYNYHHRTHFFFFSGNTKGISWNVTAIFQVEEPVIVLEMISDCLTRPEEDCS